MQYGTTQKLTTDDAEYLGSRIEEMKYQLWDEERSKHRNWHLTISIMTIFHETEQKVGWKFVESLGSRTRKTQTSISDVDSAQHIGTDLWQS